MVYEAQQVKHQKMRDHTVVDYITTDRRNETAGPVTCSTKYSLK